VKRPIFKGDLKVAAVTAIAAIGSGLVVAVASIAVAHENEQGENERVERRLDEEARGAARVLLSRFATTSSYAGAALQTNENLSFRPEYIAAATSADVKLIMGRLSATEFETVDLAMTGTTSFFVLFQVAKGRPLSPDERERVKQWRVNLSAAEQALATVADLPE
jgi:hypothetical protein